MAKYLLWQGLTQRHQEDRPVNRMETYNILSDQVQVSRPVFLILLTAFSVTVIANTGDIVGQGIQPYINDMLIIKVYRDPPLEGGSGNTQILQARKQEVVHHFILSGYRLYKFRMAVNMLDQSVSIFAHSEKICLFLCRLYLSSAVRTFAVHKLGFCPEGFTGCTVQSLIGALVNISLIVQLLKDLLYLFFMIIICCTDKVIIGGVHQIPDLPDRASHIVYIFLRCNTGLLCLQLDLLSMLIRSCLKKNIIAIFSLETGNAVCQNNLIAVSDVRFS